MTIEFPQLEIGENIGKYKVVEKIGEGGFSHVYKVKSDTGEEFALKRPKGDASSKHIRKEIEVQKLLKGWIQSMLPILDVIEYKNAENLLLPLAKPLNVREKRNLEEKLHILSDVATGLDWLHRFAHIHGDIKPSNILITKEGDVKLSDFSLAKALYEDYESSKEVINSLSVAEEYVTHLRGSLPYMAPEVQQGKKPTILSDIYSFGVLMFELLTGRLPSMNLRRELIEEGVSKKLQKIIIKATDRVERRISSLEKIMHGLEDIEQKEIEGMEKVLQSKMGESSNLSIEALDYSKSSGGLIFSASAMPFGKNLHFDESLERLRKGGYDRHFRPKEIFELLALHFERRLKGKLQDFVYSLLESGRIWLSLAIERKGNSLICYEDPRNIGWRGDKYIFYGDPKYSSKTEFNVKEISLEKDKIIPLEKFKPKFISYLCGRRLEDLPIELRETSYSWKIPDYNISVGLGPEETLFPANLDGTDIYADDEEAQSIGVKDKQ